MRINPPEAYAIGTIYRMWTRSHRTATWECLGDVLAIYAKRMGSWDKVHQFCADNLSSIPIAHLKLAYADHRLRHFVSGVLTRTLPGPEWSNGQQLKHPLNHL
jgi:hypothetical protein